MLLADPAIDEGNRTLATFDLASQASSNKAVRIHALCQHKWAPMLAVAPVTLKMKVYFNISNLGGSKICPDNVIVGLEGLAPNANPIVFPTEGLLKQLDFKFPQESDFTTTVDCHTFEALTPHGNTKVKDAPYILLPLLLARVVIENNERDPAMLAIMFREAMVEFDDLHKDDHTMNTATTSLKNILPFLWGSANKKVPPLERLADIDDSHL